MPDRFGSILLCLAAIVMLAPLLCNGFRSSPKHLETPVNCEWVKTLDEKYHSLSHLPLRLVNAYRDCLVNFIQSQNIDRITNLKDGVWPTLKSKHPGFLYDIALTDLLNPPLRDTVDAHDKGQYVSLHVEGLTITAISPDASLGSALVAGDVLLAWNDTRMTWTNSTLKQHPRYHANELFLFNDKHFKFQDTFWLPAAVFPPLANGHTPETKYQTMMVDKSGHVYAHLEFSNHLAECQYDFTYYPYDTTTCALVFRATDTSHTTAMQFSGMTDAFAIKFNEDVQKAALHPDWVFDSAHTKITTASILIDPSDILPDAGLTIEFRLQRQALVAYIECILPVTIATILAAVAPFFGALAWHVGIKLFSILLLFLSLQDLISNHKTQLRFGNEVPNLVRFFEFSLVWTLVTTLVALACLRVTQTIRRSVRMPPPHKLFLACDLVCRFFSCVPKLNADWPDSDHVSTVGVISRNSTMSIEEPQGIGHAAYAKQWMTVMSAAGHMWLCVATFLYAVVSVGLCHHLWIQ